MDKIIGHRLTLFLALLLVGSFVAPLAISGVASAANLRVTFSITPTTADVGQSVSFTCTVTSGYAPYTFLWTFGDGYTSTLQNTSHTYSASGSYAVTLLVQDSRGNRHRTLPTTITINGPLSVTGMATPTTIEVGQSVSFTATPSGGIAPYTYSWTFGDGGTSTSQNPSHTYIAAGTYTVTVTVTDLASNAAQWRTSIMVSSVHAPIVINGNSQFNNTLFPSNGVVSGSGTASDPYIIEGWNINAGTANGILIENTNASFIVRDCYIHDGGSSYNGIYLYNCVNGVLDNNTCSNNVVGIGLDSSSNGTLSNNVMINDGIEIYGISLSHWNTHDIDTSNTVNGKPVYYYKNQSGITVPAGAGQVILANCTDIIVEGQNLSDCGVGVELGFSSGITVTHDNCSNNQYGIYLLSSSDNTLNNNNCSNNWNGIYLLSSSDNTLNNNNCSNGGDGIWLSWSSGCTLSNNNCSNNAIGGAGIYLYSSCDNTLSNNNCSNNWDGIYLSSSSGNNTISNNSCSKNSMLGIYLLSSSGNMIWNNTLINNYIQAYDDGTSNSWNSSGSPHGYGNWWSDLQTPDILPPFGIVDIPYQIAGSASAEDFYPLTIAISISGTASPTSGISPLNVSFTCSASKGTGPYTYSWTFGDGCTSTLQNPSHRYSVGGTFTAAVTVIDSASHAAQWTSTAITVMGIVNVTGMATPTTIEVGQSVSFTATPSGGIAPYTYSWTFGDGGTSTSQNSSHTYSTAGTYTAKVNVTDSASHSTIWTSPTINVVPSLSIAGVASPTSGTEPLSVSFTCTSTDGIGPYTYSWTFGDGNTSTLQNPLHKYNSKGTYMATVTVTDSAFYTAQWSSPTITVYFPHATILINGNSQFNASNGVVSGSGTASDPYIIEGWDINASAANGIEIENTNAYFIVRDCYLYDGSLSYSGIYLFNCTNGNLSNNSCSDNRDGIGLNMSSDNTLSNNNCNSNNQHDIYLSSSSDNNTLINNSCSNSWEGISLSSSSDNTISWNQLFNNAQYGVGLDSGSSNNTISNNTFINNYIQAYDAGTSNSWNSSSSPHGYGNYWSDWTTPDDEAPWGIIDNPYNINGSAGAKDYYPLAYQSNMDNSPPHTNLSISGTLGSSGWYISDVTIFLNASDSVSGVNRIEYSTDGGPWLVYNGPISIISEGQHNLSYYSVDIAGNTEPVSSTTFKIDNTPPSGSISIQNGSAFVNTPSVTLSLTADAISGIDMVRYSNDSITWSAWESFSAYKDWSLPSGDGIKTVYYQVMDNAGLISTFSDTIILDTTPPTGSITIDSGAMYANTASVTLTLTGSDATSGVAQIRFSNNDVTWSAWQAFSTSTSWTLSSGDGLKTVYYQIMDNASNVKMYNARIILDTTAPTGSIVIDSGATYANTTSVTLTLTGSDATSGVAQIRFSNNDVTWSAWQAFSTSTSWTMASDRFRSGDGTKTVYVQFMDAAGNPSLIYNDTIILDRIPPALAFGIASGVDFTGSSATINWSATDAYGIIIGYECSLDGGTFVFCGPMTQIDLTNMTAGSHNLTVRAIDGAGNVAEKKLQFNVMAPGPSGSSGPSSSGGLVPWLLVIIAILAIMLLLFFLLRKRKGEEKSPAEVSPAPPPPAADPIRLEDHQKRLSNR